MCAKFGTIVIANYNLAGGGRDLWITLYLCVVKRFQSVETSVVDIPGDSVPGIPVPDKPSSRVSWDSQK